MLTHVVLFKLRDKSPEILNTAVAKLQSLQGKIPQLVSLSIGADVIHTERSYDLALVAVFASQADMQAYQIHPEHVKVSEYMTSIRESVIAVDFES
ncbi:MAG: Dabb family protein [Methylocystaceae bacterium]